jgi:hypothetical protein
MAFQTNRKLNYVAVVIYPVSPPCWIILQRDRDWKRRNGVSQLSGYYCIENKTQLQNEAEPLGPCFLRFVSTTELSAIRRASSLVGA